MSSGPVILELPFGTSADAKRALQRGAYRLAARALRERLGYPGAALALEALVEELRSPHDHEVVDDGEDTVVLALVG